ncbi:MAG: HAMP domain-containing histidine kinase [Dehalococcoidia bacterium]|nr:HAMP domain-containing histidine kinase [Dehalococcoidia bacterium]
MLGWIGRRLRSMRYLLVWPAVTAYRNRAGRSLRWRLAGYNLATLVAGLATALILVGALAAAGASARRYAEEEPADDARVVAAFLVSTGLINPGDRTGTEDLGPVLAALASGQVPLYRGPDRDQFDVRPKQFLQGVSGIAIISPDSEVPEVVAGEFSGAPAALEAVVAEAREGRTGLRGNSRLDGGSGVGAYPVVDSDGTVRAVVIVEKSDIQAPQGARAIVRAEVRPVVMSVWVGSIVAAIPGLALAGLLAVAAARSVGGRIRDVAAAAESLAGGSLASRVPVRGEDEVASLAGSFNLMAGRLQETMASVEAERARAVALLDANRQLVANVSHELRTPVALIRGQVEALEEDTPGNPRVEMALRETTRLESLVTDLFQLASAEAGALRFDIAPVDLAVVVRESIAPLVELARRDARVAVALEAPQAVLALADSGRLARVIQNLVRNAIRHVPEGGMVRVVVGASGTMGTISVTDTGAGIALEDMPHVFERFYRGEASRNRDSGGAGLGLAMAKEFVEGMGGAIAVSSPPGEGATFIVSLPLAAADSPARHAPATD